MPESAVPQAEGAGARPGYHAMRTGLAVGGPQREVVRATGPDALAFLQGQLSQDVGRIAAGASAWSWLLQPAGKVEALVRVTRLADDDWLLDTDAGWGAAVIARLTRFKLRTKVDLTLEAGWAVVGLRGPDATEASTGGTLAVVDAGWPGLPGVDLIGPSPSVPPTAVVATAEDWQAARIEAGIPVMGAELTERTIPAETGLVERTVSFTKGCYTGQELVARIDSRGANVPRLLRGVRLDGLAAAGAVLRTEEGAEVGVLTSVGTSPDLGPVALGYVRRGTDPGATLITDGGVRAVVAVLPLVG